MAKQKSDNNLINIYTKTRDIMGGGISSLI